MAASRRAPDPNLVPIRVTRRFPTFHSGRVETWGAETLDGEWYFERFEEPGTPWGVYHRASVRDFSYRLPIVTLTTLRKCRIYVGRGWAVEDLNRLKAERAARKAAPAATMES
jgi:hypothetical protein